MQSNAVKKVRLVLLRQNQNNSMKTAPLLYSEGLNS